ncbi:MAG: 50S ribosomal protein L24 [Deltaproteobacteria bacterium]|nr:MAG: 50S ribosomal protein L24 [Deltaproteobacteria bacterium]
MIRKNDEVIVIAGKEKGKKGKILSFSNEGARARVEKLNMVKRHVRPNQKMPQGGIVEKEASIHVSNLMIYCGKCKKGIRTAVKLGKDSKKQRVCKKCESILDN